MYAFLRQPYESTEVDEKQEDYFSYNWTYQGSPSYGFALAFIMDSMALSICDDRWNHSLFYIHRNDNEVAIRNLYDASTLLYHQEWLRNKKPITLAECLIEPKDKKIKLRDDHGKDILQAFSEKLVKSRYVCEVVNSLPYNSFYGKFIHDIKDDGMIEIVLPWTDRRLGIAVQTTGRDRRETEEIARLLEEKYGRR